MMNPIDRFINGLPFGRKRAEFLLSLRMPM
jgi:hypothetical protein